MEKIAALDVDGVLLDCDHAFSEVGSQVLGRKLVKLNNEYDLGKRYNVSDEEVLHIFEEMKSHDCGWSGMKIIEGALVACLKLKRMGYKIHLVTAVTEDLKNLRLNCLINHGIEPDGIHCAGHHLASKVEIIRKLNPEIMIDDRLRHLYESDFVPHRVWIDNGDTQDGLEVNEDLYQAKNILTFVNQWENGRVKKPNLRIVKF